MPTTPQSIGGFTVLDAPRAGYIADREEAIIRVSENVSDHFIRNLCTILAENRALLIVEDANAIVTGNLSHAG